MWDMKNIKFHKKEGGIGTVGSNRDVQLKSNKDNNIFKDKSFIKNQKWNTKTTELDLQ
jgi:hypothetical protein